jgi:3-oxoacyl-[acyl-carrier-protein] synthase II
VAEHRVVVTGMGPVSSIGTGWRRFVAALRRGRSGVSPISAFDTTGFAHANGCEVRGFQPERHIRRLDPAELGRTSQLAVAAAALALRQAGVDPAGLADRRGLVCVGTTDGESQDLDRAAELCLRGGVRAVPVELIRRYPASWISAWVAHEFRLTAAEVVTLPTACAAGNYAIGYAFDVLRAGEAEYAICGGADAMCRKTFAGFYRLGAIAPEACQPFDADRRGILTGEGAGMLFLETLDSARGRGARVYAEIRGHGLSCDAKHPVAPDPASIVDCMRRAHANAGIDRAEVGFVSAHGTGTKANDLAEAAAIREVFGDAPPPTVSVKSMLGHTMGAASALAAIACVAALEHRFIPPTINHRQTDPACRLDCVPNQARRAAVRVAQNNAFAFGGNNCVLILAVP